MANLSHVSSEKIGDSMQDAKQTLRDASEKVRDKATEAYDDVRDWAGQNSGKLIAGAAIAVGVGALSYFLYRGLSSDRNSTPSK